MQYRRQGSDMALQKEDLDSYSKILSNTLGRKSNKEVLYENR